MVNVTLLAKPRILPEAMTVMSWPTPCGSADYLAEFAGRACYQSFDRPNPKTRQNKDYLRNIIGLGHESILEHAQFTFYITGVSRSLTHELVRHRHLSFSELSQRYVDVEDTRFVEPPLMRQARRETAPEGTTDETLAEDFRAKEVWSKVREAYAGVTSGLAELGYPRKRAREAARSVMPNATETRLVVSGNVRAWRHVLRLRGSEHADAEIRELALALLDVLYSEAPASFADFTVETLADGREVIR